jgi:hypothetical protein
MECSARKEYNKLRQHVLEVEKKIERAKRRSFSTDTLEDQREELIARRDNFLSIAIETESIPQRFIKSVIEAFGSCSHGETLASE